MPVDIFNMAVGYRSPSILTVIDIFWYCQYAKIPCIFAYIFGIEKSTENDGMLEISVYACMTESGPRPLISCFGSHVHVTGQYSAAKNY
jgi:hypothetical protein